MIPETSCMVSQSNKLHGFFLKQAAWFLSQTSCLISQSNKLYNFSVMQAMPSKYACTTNSQANRLGNFQAHRRINFQAKRLIFRQTDFSGKHTGCMNSQANRVSSFLRPAGCVTVQASRSHSCKGQPAVPNFRPTSCMNFQAGRLCEFLAN